MADSLSESTGAAADAGAQIADPAPKPMGEIDFNHYKKIQEVNVNGTFLVLNAVSAAMVQQELVANNAKQPARGACRGSIINLASVTSFKIFPHEAGYTSSKHAVLGLTRSAGKHSPQV